MMFLRRLLRSLYLAGTDVLNFLGSKISISAWLIGIPYVVAGVASGLAVVLYSRVFHYAEEIAYALFDINPYLFLFVSPLLIYGGWLLIRYSSKAAAGSGIPQVMAGLKTLDKYPEATVRHLLSFKVIVMKVISSSLGIMSGAAIGREGPSLQISASIYMIVHRLKPSSWPNVNKQKMVVAGGAAGLAAAFNTPLGGIVFAIEELSKSSIHSFRSSLLLSVILAGLTAQGLLGSYLYLGYPKVGTIELKYYIIIILVASVTGIAGALKSKIILALNDLKKKFKHEWQRHFYVIFTGLVIAVLIILTGKDAIGSGKEQLQALLFGESTQPDWLLFPIRFFASLVSFTSGIAGGVFAPSLATGASVGALFSHFTNFDDNNKIFILCGMIGFLTGVTRSPFTSAVLVLEMTDRHSALFPMMLAAVTANFAAALIMKKSLYEHLMYNYLNEKDPEPSDIKIF